MAETAPRRHRVAVIAIDGGPLFELAVPCAVFGAHPAYALEVCGEARRVATSAALELAVPAPLAAARGADTIIVPTWPRPGEEPPAELLDLLRAEHARGARIVGLCLGAYVLAAAGLLDGLAATTHWEFSELLARLHPRVDVTRDAVFVDHGRLVTAAGSASGLDCCLHLVAVDLGAAAAAAVAHDLVAAPRRAGTSSQVPPTPAAHAEHAFQEALAWAEQELGDGIDVDDLARHLCASRRSVERLFRSALGVGPAAWLAARRVDAARRLLEETELPVEAIAERAGFGTAATLRRRFVAALGVAPAAYRADHRRRADQAMQREAAPVAVGAAR